MRTPVNIAPPQHPDSKMGAGVFWMCAAVALLIRVWCSTLGHNYDYESFNLVADLANKGKNVYAETPRFNYGPLFIWIFAGLKSLFTTHFRTAISVLISLADIGIAALLYQRGNRKASLFILFSPVCIIISGFHNQIDNYSILIALIALRYVETRKQYDSYAHGLGLKDGQVLLFALLLGVSLVAKHILIFLPFWLLLHKNLTPKQKFLSFSIPYTIFLLSFLPYWAGRAGIIHNVFQYDPGENAPIYTLLLGKPVIEFITVTIGLPLRTLFFLLMVGVGFFMRKRSLIEILAHYYLFMLLLSSGTYTHYLVIPMLFLAIYQSRSWYWYNGFLLVYLLFHRNQMNLIAETHGTLLDVATFIIVNGLYIAVLILLCALIHVHRPEFLRYKTFSRFIGRYL